MPCKHTGLCKECIILILKDKQICPYCKEEVKMVFLIEMKKDEDEYIVKGQIKSLV